MHTQTNHSRLRALDFLRGLAILSVILVHASQRFPSEINSLDYLAGLGRFGVQLFFFISAFTMCYMWKLREGESNPVKNFYLRRFFRIAPLFWMAIPFYLLANGFDIRNEAPEGVGAKQILLTATFLHGFTPNSINSVVQGGWSIAVEMTFYTLFPLLILKIKDKKLLYLSLAFIIWLFNILIFKDFITNYFSATNQAINTLAITDFLYYNFINQAPIFLIGCYLFYLQNHSLKNCEIFIFISWILLGIALQIFAEIDGIKFLAVYLAIGLFTYICIKKNIRFNLIEKLGKNSYAIYLLHFLILNLLQKIMPIQAGVIALTTSIILTILISYFLSLFIHKFFEIKIYYFLQKLIKI
jgi:peptidoglycan/LPS O-acetylase OafA/YrhL